MKIFLALLLFIRIESVVNVNHCCSFPCQNNGICMTTGHNNYICDCTSTDYYGRNCHIPTFIKWIKSWFTPSPDTAHYIVTHYDWLWNFINGFSFIHDRLMKFLYVSRSNKVDTPLRFTSGYDYITLESYFNTSYYGRELPPVPKDCPTPMGVAGKQQLPDIDSLVDKFFTRKQFIPDPLNSNLLFAFFAQHFTHQFFKTDFDKGPAFTWGGHGVDVSHIYGRNEEERRKLRSFKNGKLKSQIINNEEWPPLITDAPVKRSFPRHIPQSKQFVLGHPVFTMLPGLFMYGTIWLREHNRVCDILSQEHPEWTDDQLYETGRLILLGETIKIVIEDYVQHLSNYNVKLVFKPELLFGEPFQYQNSIRLEFNHLYHWHPLMPDSLNISGKYYPVEEVLHNVDVVFEKGLKALVESFSSQIAGKMSHHNHGNATLNVLKAVIKHGRDLRVQPFNNYRKRFGLSPYTSFEELTGETKMAKELKQLYGSIDAMEFYPALLLEKIKDRSIFASTIIEIGGPFSVKGLMSNPLCSQQYWKPSTFGGEVGFNIVKTASLEKLFCQNIQGKCPRVSFKVPPEVAAETINTYQHCKSEL